MTNMRGYTLFETVLGDCGIAWAGSLIIASQLPEVSPDATRRRLCRALPDLSQALPPPFVAAAIAAVTQALAGDPVDLAAIPLDMDRLGAFDRRVLTIARAIPAGETLTYGEIATRLGDRTLARAVGQALGRNPFAPIIPCHRVLGADGKAGGFSAGDGVSTKLRLLTIERARTGIAPGLFDNLPLAVQGRPASWQKPGN